MPPQTLIEKFLGGQDIDVSSLSDSARMNLAYSLICLQNGRGNLNIVAKSAIGSPAYQQKRIKDLLARLQKGE